MPATELLEREMTFHNVPLNATKRGFSIPCPAVLRTLALTGKENPKDKEWDGNRSALFLIDYPKKCLGTMVYKPLGKAGVTKTVTNAREVTQQEWLDAKRDWQTFLRDNAETWTNTYATVIATLPNNRLITRTVVPSAVTATPVPMPAPVQNGPVTMKTWDPNDLDIAHDLFDVPNDDPAFQPDKELFTMMDALWAQANMYDEPRMLLIMGDTSTGKTFSPIVWCARNDVLHCRIDCGGFGEIYDVTGPIKASVTATGSSFTEWVKGKTIRAFADPRPAVIQLDEVNRISDVKAMNVLFPFLDASRQSYFDDAQAWMKLNGVKLIVATMNGDTRGDDIGEYVGTQPLDQAFISRFPIRRQLRYPAPDKLAQILEARNGGIIPPETIELLATIANELVLLNKFVPNFRELFAAMDFLKQGHDMYKALKWTVGGIYKDDGTVACDFTSFKSVLQGKNINTDETP